MTVEWQLRPLDYRRFLNPAYCGLLMTRCIKDFEDSSRQGMPLALCFVVLPMVTATATRAVLPSYASTSFAGWLHDHPEVRVGLAARVRSLNQITRESLLFYIRRDALTITVEQRVSVVPRRVSSSDTLENASTAVSDMVEKARFLGRWFARSGDPATIYFLLGLRP
jgi:hypothetical protein